MLSLSRQDNEVCDARLAVRKGCKGVVVRGGGGGGDAWSLSTPLWCKMFGRNCDSGARSARKVAP